MITGTVRGREPIIPLRVSDSGPTSQQVEAAIDTGYNGFLTLSESLITALQLTFAGHRRGTLADGTVARLEVYLGTVNWHGQPKDVLVAQTVGIPLAGMSLLDGSRVTIDAVDGGDVTIETLPLKFP